MLARVCELIPGYADKVNVTPWVSEHDTMGELRCIPEAIRTYASVY